jgi:hypothetical protein
MPSSRYFNTEYQYEIININEDIIKRINKKLEDGKELIETSNEKSISPRHIAWVKSFSSIIQEIDPLGEIDTWSSEHSESLAKEWHHAQYGYNFSTNDRESLKITLKQYDSILFGSYLSVVYSLLGGKAKVVKSKKRIPKICDDLNGKSLYNTISYLDLNPNISVINNLVFVFMPFTEPWSDYIWGKQIRNIVESIQPYKLICKRADDLYGRDVMRDIVESIIKARIIIAEITGRNANVFYELGIAHALNKEVILLTQKVDDIPFDLNRFRYCIYSNDGEGYEKLDNHLRLSISEIIENKSSENNEIAQI